MAHFFIIINENLTEYSLNVTLLCTNYRNDCVVEKNYRKYAFFISNKPYPALKIACSIGTSKLLIN